MRHWIAQAALDAAAARVPQMAAGNGAMQDASSGFADFHFQNLGVSGL
jgi:hypothetical protein